MILAAALHGIAWADVSLGLMLEQKQGLRHPVELNGCYNPEAFND